MHRTRGKVEEVQRRVVREMAECSCDCCSCSEQDGGCSCSDTAYRGMHSENSSNNSNNVKSCSCSCSYRHTAMSHLSLSSCTCSVYSSCYYTEGSSATNHSRCSGCSSAYTFRKESLIAVPQLLQFRTVPLPASAPVAQVGVPRLSTTLLPPPKPLLVLETTGAEVGKSVEETAVCIDVQQTRRSIGMQTIPDKVTRGTSPSLLRSVDAANNTEITAEVWTEQQRDFQQQLRRNVCLETQKSEIEAALMAAHRRLVQDQENHVSTMQSVMAFNENMRLELQQMEVVSRLRILEHETDEWSFCSALCESSIRETIMVQEMRAKHEQLACGEAAFMRLWENTKHHFLLDEERQRCDVWDAEQQFRLDLWRMFALSLDSQRQLASTSAALERVEQEKRVAIASNELIEQQLRESLQREKELRLQYLHVLRLPTTTIVTNNPRSNIGAAADEKDDNLSVHARFARAHKEAADAIRAQRRYVSRHTNVF